MVEVFSSPGNYLVRYQGNFTTTRSTTDTSSSIAILTDWFMPPAVFIICHLEHLLNRAHFPHRTHEGLPCVNFLPHSLQKVTPGFSGFRRLIIANTRSRNIHNGYKSDYYQDRIR
ncbi:MAG: hypothetical protein [Circular genetic element sp.]|nr:MAG: hypothetical protein [Circular genetic element sp.]